VKRWIYRAFPYLPDGFFVSVHTTGMPTAVLRDPNDEPAFLASVQSRSVLHRSSNVNGALFRCFLIVFFFFLYCLFCFFAVFRAETVSSFLLRFELDVPPLFHERRKPRLLRLQLLRRIMYAKISQPSTCSLTVTVLTVLNVLSAECRANGPVFCGGCDVDLMTEGNSCTPKSFELDSQAEREAAGMPSLLLPARCC
jgi:hypothetical protein